MAIPTTKATFKDYCLRNLGFGVIDINVSDAQADDRIDEALQYFAQYHYDGVERMYLKYKVSSDDITRATTDDTSSATDSADGTVSATFYDGKNYIPMPSNVMSVLQIFPFTDKAALNLFDVRYQLRLNDLYDFSSTSIIHYDMVLRHLDFLDHILVGEKPIRFNQYNNKLFVDMDWKNDISVGEYLVIECFRKLDPTVMTDVYNDIYLKRYTTALIKRQWGANLSKFNGVAMLGGVTLNGQQIFSEAQDDIRKLEEEIRGTYETPVTYMIG